MNESLVKRAKRTFGPSGLDTDGWRRIQYLLLGNLEINQALFVIFFNLCHETLQR